MKLFIFMYLFNLYGYSQQGEITYIFSEPENKNLYKPILQFDDTKSVFIYNRTGYDSSQIEGMEKKDDGGVNLKFTSGDELGNQVYTDFSNKKVIERIAYSKITDAYIMKDNWVPINWDIKSQIKNIGNYKVTKAVGAFRGREYTVWFTYDIPLPIGPWKLKGLPGAILEARDSEGTFEVKFVSIKYPCDCFANVAVPTAAKELSLKEHVYLKDNFDDVLLKKIQSRMPSEMRGRLTRIEKSQTEKRKQRKERVYEWELETVNEKKK